MLELNFRKSLVLAVVGSMGIALGVCASGPARTRATYDGRWWLSTAPAERTGFLDGYFDCYTYEYKGPAKFTVNPPAIAHDLVTKFYEQNPARISEPVPEVLYRFRDRPGQTSTATGGEPIKGRHGFYDGTYWKQIGALGGKAEQLGFVEGYLWCHENLSGNKGGVFSKSPAEYAALITHWYGFVEDTSDINAKREPAKVADVFFKFRHQVSSPRGRAISLGMAQHGQRLTSRGAIAEARRNVQKPGSSFTVLREIVANAETRRIGDQALEQAKTHHIKLYKNGILADFLRSGGFLVAETEPWTTNVIALHLVSLGPDGAPKDAVYWCSPPPAAKLADVEGLVKATAEFTEEFYSTPPSAATSLESRFYGGRFPRYDDDGPNASLFAVPRSLLKLGADPNEVREAEALVDSLTLLEFQYAASMPDFSANPIVATEAAAEKWEALQEEFLRNNHMNPDLDIVPENIQSKEQLGERVDLLRKMDKFMEEALEYETNPALVKANISVAAIPLEVSQADPFYWNGKPTFSSATANLLVFYWQRLPTGGFAVVAIGAAG